MMSYPLILLWFSSGIWVGTCRLARRTAYHHCYWDPTLALRLVDACSQTVSKMTWNIMTPYQYISIKFNQYMHIYAMFCILMANHLRKIWCLLSSLQLCLCQERHPEVDMGDTDLRLLQVQGWESSLAPCGWMSGRPVLIPIYFLGWEQPMWYLYVFVCSLLQSFAHFGSCT